MPTWIRFQFETGHTSLVNADQSYFVFKPDEKRIEVFSAAGGDPSDTDQLPVCLYHCDSPNQVTAAEELIFDAVSRNQPLSVNLDVLDDYADYLNNVHGVRMVLQLLHYGNIRIPMESEFDEQDLFDEDNQESRTEIGQFEELLHNYLEVPDDSLRRAYKKGNGDLPFELATDHEECEDHGFHEYWVIKTLPDRHYTFRESYKELVSTISEKEGYEMELNS